MHVARVASAAECSWAVAEAERHAGWYAAKKPTRTLTLTVTLTLTLTTNPNPSPDPDH